MSLDILASRNQVLKNEKKKKREQKINFALKLYTENLKGFLNP
jgi:hypothetical protein